MILQIVLALVLGAVVSAISMILLFRGVPWRFAMLLPPIFTFGAIVWIFRDNGQIDSLMVVVAAFIGIALYVSFLYDWKKRGAFRQALESRGVRW